jgi:signal transduction histidine kinase
MRIQTRLFLGTAALVLALMGLQWWIYSRQLRSIEGDLGRVATTVGREILSGDLNVFFDEIDADAEAHTGFTWVAAGGIPATDEETKRRMETPILVVPDGAKVEVKHFVKQRIAADGGASEPETVVEENCEVMVGPEAGEETGDGHERRVEAFLGDPVRIKRLTVAVEGEEVDGEKFLVVREHDRHLRKIPIPVSPTVERVRATMQRSAAVGGMLLVVGLVASAVLSRRLTRPLRELADGAEALGHGDLGVQVPVSAVGEVGDLQRSFNRMSERLAELEAEREQWRQREHLAQLGDLSRGLAHTLRNPLHTLGLAVEELAEGEGDRKDLVATSRNQIRRIDRWLRSFLALGAGESAASEIVDLDEIVRGVALESVQQGSVVEVESDGGGHRAQVVPGAVRAAVANLVENATEVSPAGEAVVVGMERAGDEVVIRVVDRGPGLPEEVRRRLFSPHVTTKVGGAGMGLFLARQLIEGMHGGRLEIMDGDGGGTVAAVRLPLAERTGDE